MVARVSTCAAAAFCAVLFARADKMKRGRGAVPSHPTVNEYVMRSVYGITFVRCKGKCRQSVQIQAILSHGPTGLLWRYRAARARPWW